MSEFYGLILALNEKNEVKFKGQSLRFPLNKFIATLQYQKGSLMQYIPEEDLNYAGLLELYDDEFFEKEEITSLIDLASIKDTSVLIKSLMKIFSELNKNKAEMLSKNIFVNESDWFQFRDPLMILIGIIESAEASNCPKVTWATKLY